MKRSLVRWIGLSVCAVLAALALQSAVFADVLVQKSDILQSGANLAGIIQIPLVILSLILVLRQLGQNTELTRAANAQALVEHAATLNTLLMQDAELAAIWYSAGKTPPDGPGKMVRERYREMLVQWLIFHENIFYQNQKGLLDPVVYDSWARDLRITVKEHNLSVVADNLEELFPSRFGRELAALQREFARSDSGR